MSKEPKRLTKREEKQLAIVYGDSMEEEPKREELGILKKKHENINRKLIALKLDCEEMWELTVKYYKKWSDK